MMSKTNPARVDASSTDGTTTRLQVIETFIKHPPQGEFERGYFIALMDEAVDDIDEAASDIFESGLQLISEQARRTYIARRAKTLA